MKVSVDYFQEVPRELAFCEPPDSFPVLAAMAESGGCSFVGPVQVHLSVSREVDHYRVEGNVSVSVHQTCSRCLCTYDQEVLSRFTIFFRKATTLMEDENEVELDEQDLISASFTGDEIDLLPEIGEQVALAVPLKPLCSESCKGLCPVCGIDLNTETCTCSREPLNVKFAALQDFKVQR